MTFELDLNGSRHRVVIPGHKAEGLSRILLDGEEHTADLRLIQPNVLSLLLSGISFRIIFDTRNDGDAVVVDAERSTYRVIDPRELRSRSRAEGAEAGVRSVIAPMPGRIIRLLVQPGETVTAQQGLLVMEAMKMQNELKSPKSGTVRRITVEAGATVQAGQALIAIE